MVKKSRKILSVIFYVAWAIVIFALSACPASTSSSQSGFLVDIIKSIFHTDSAEPLTTIVRKSAHFTEYIILGVLAFNLARAYRKPKYPFYFLAVIYAISDEVHQIFVPGRSCELRDTLIDITGLTLGFFAFYLINKGINKKKSTQSTSKS